MFMSTKNDFMDIFMKMLMFHITTSAYEMDCGICIGYNKLCLLYTVVPRFLQTVVFLTSTNSYLRPINSCLCTG